jgi:hypothetical protein
VTPAAGAPRKTGITFPAISPREAAGRLAEAGNLYNSNQFKKTLSPIETDMLVSYNFIPVICKK